MNNVTIESRRREFIRTMAGALASGVASAAACGVPEALATLHEELREERLHRLNYGRFQQRLREVVEDGHDVHHCELLAPRDGFRFVRVHVKEGPLTWHQPWEGECI